ncbi:MAG: alpha/beta hydrolase-fold protein [Rubrivivax sp.]
MKAFPPCTLATAPARQPEAPSRRALLGALAASGLAMPGCAVLGPPPPATVPMQVVHLRGATPAPRLIVMLPGAYSRPQEFIDEGFTTALSAAGIDADVAIADSHLGYFNDRTVLQRLHDDVLAPARALYREVWLVGISLGGFLALGTTLRHPALVDGVLLLAPYLGPRRVMQAISAGGGPRPWAAALAQQPPLTDEDLDRELWARMALNPPPQPLYLGYGVDDRFADAHRVFATLLPPTRVRTAPGGHDWPAWRALWQQWLNQGPLAARAFAGG